MRSLSLPSLPPIKNGITLSKSLPPHPTPSSRPLWIPSFDSDSFLPLLLPTPSPTLYRSRTLLDLFLDQRNLPSTAIIVPSTHRTRYIVVCFLIRFMDDFGPPAEPDSYSLRQRPPVLIPRFHSLPLSLRPPTGFWSSPATFVSSNSVHNPSRLSLVSHLHSDSYLLLLLP